MLKRLRSEPQPLFRTRLRLRVVGQPAFIGRLSGIQNGISSSNSSPSDLRGSSTSSGSTGAAVVGFGGGAAVAAPSPDRGGLDGEAAVACFGGGIRTRSAGVSVPRTGTMVGKMMMTLPTQP